MSDETKIKLKPCPFCGGQVTLIESMKEWIKCHNSDCYLNSYWWGGPPKEVSSRTIRAWNTRFLEKYND